MPKLCYFLKIILSVTEIMLLTFYTDFKENEDHQWLNSINFDFNEHSHTPPSSHSRPQRPRSFWSAPRIATSGQVQHRKSAIHGLPVTLRMFRVKSDKSDWFWSQSTVFSKPFKNGMSLDRARGRDSWC